MPNHGRRTIADGVGYLKPSAITENVDSCTFDMLINYAWLDASISCFLCIIYSMF